MDKRLANAGASADVIARVKNQFFNINDTFGMVNYLNMDSTNSTLSAVTLLNYHTACGGDQSYSPQFSICTTNITNHKHASVVASYMSDGTSSSIALKKVLVRQQGDIADLSWTYLALKTILGGDISTTILPETIPGSVSTILWWSSVNLQGISPAFLDVGIEAMYTLVLRAGMQRTYPIKHDFCTQNVADESFVVLTISSSGYTYGMCFVIGELLILFLCLVFCIPRFIQQQPISPAIRVTNDYTYFILMLTGPFTATILSENKSSVVTDDIWNKFDVPVRIGETIHTKEDPEQGVIVVDRPKFVSNLVRGKKYC